MTTIKKIEKFIPSLTQHKGYTCGVASLQMLLHYYDIHLSQDEIEKLVYCDYYRGTHIWSICGYLNNNGFQSKVFYCDKENAEKLGFKSVYDFEISFDEGFEIIRNEIDNQRPVIFLYTNSRKYDYSKPSLAEGHYSLIKGYTVNENNEIEDIIYNDPCHTVEVTIKKERLKEIWYDCYLHGRPNSPIYGPFVIAKKN